MMIQNTLTQNLHPYCHEENSHPPIELFNLTCVLFTTKLLQNASKSCIQHILPMFQQIYESCHLAFKSENEF